MSVHRLSNIPGFSIDRVAAAAGSDPDVLRLENMDTDLPPPAEAIAATHAALSSDDANSYLPFTGSLELRMAVAQRLFQQTGRDYHPDQEVVITCGGTEGIFDVLLATTDPGDEVILTDPTYAGMINRVRLAGAVPKLVPLMPTNGEWRFDLDALHQAVNQRTRSLLLTNPSMPSGAVFNQEEWEAITAICQEHNLWLIYNAAQERILYDDLPYFHPASQPGMLDRTITIGSVSKEYRMIGWRVGWVVGPATIMQDIARVHIYNVVTPTGIAQAGACAALQLPTTQVAESVTEWQRRRDMVSEQLHDLPFVRADGGWSLLIDTGAMGHDAASASRLLLEQGKVAATPMHGWGERNGAQFIRFVFSNEPVTRLAELRDRVTHALL